MINHLKGIVTKKNPPELVIELSNGISYELTASMNTFYQLPELGESLSLFTHFIVREDAQLLYGFFHEEERTLFRLLIKVNGVGPKMAITLLSSITPLELVQCIHANDISRLVSLPGIGKKTAERLIIEMRDRLHNFSPQEPSNQGSSMVSDALSALIVLGYKPQEAKNALDKNKDKVSTSQELIRLSLKLLAG